MTTKRRTPPLPGQIILMVAAIVASVAAVAVSAFTAAYWVGFAVAALAVLLLFVVYPPGHGRNW